MKITALLLSFAPFVSACTETHVLAWLDTADANQMANRDTTQGRYRFFSVCGYACQVVGVGSINAQRCYRNAAVEPIDGTSDVILSKEQERLTKKAYEFAT